MFSFNHCGALWVPIPRLLVVLLSSSIDAASAMFNYSPSLGGGLR